MDRDNLSYIILLNPNRLLGTELLLRCYAVTQVFIICLFSILGLTEEDLAGVLDCNPSITATYGIPVKNHLQINDPPKSAEVHVTETPKEQAEMQQPMTNGTSGEPLSDLDFISSQSSQYVNTRFFYYNLVL